MESEFSDEVKEAMMYLTKEMQKAQNPSLARQSLHSSESEELERKIKVGSFYEVDHSKLPPKSPEQLYSIRIVMVNDEASQRVSLRFPSVHSLRTHFSEESHDKQSQGKKLPALDEKYVMGSDMAAKVLLRRIPPQEMAERGNFWSFWSPPSQPSEEKGSDDVDYSKRGSCWSHLKFDGMVQWGRRRQVRFLNRHEEYALEGTGPSVHDDKNKEKEDEDDDDDGDSEDNDDEDGEEEDEEEESEEVEEGQKEEDEEEDNVEVVMTRRSSKRKIPSKDTSKPGSSKTAKRKKQNQPVNTKSGKKTFFRNSIDRWSAARYKLAEENMLKIMKAKGAFFGKPMLRPALRAEARKLIGDTGLLDHLLKHMAGKLAPGGAERFRRRHNSDGAMEYWIESADLMNIRKQAGVQDPYWTPPPGWKPGDNPLQDPISAREIESLKKEMAKMKMNHQELRKEVKRIEEEGTKTKRHVEELSFNKPEQDLAMAILPKSILTSVQSDNESSPILMNIMRMEMHYKSKIEELLMEYCECLNEMKGRTLSKSGNMITEPEEPPIALPTESQKSLPPQPDHSETTRGLRKTKGQRTKSAEDTRINKFAEDKATKIQRLKSGFRICKPQGSFLWPNMVTLSDPQAVDHDPLLVPTPPSASSTSAPRGSCSLPHTGSHPPSPVKPLAEKRPIKTTTLFTVSKDTSSNSSIPPPPKTHNNSQAINVFNLNEAPNEQITDDTTEPSTTAEKEKQEGEGKGTPVNCCENDNQQ